MAQVLYKDARIVIVKFTINEYEKLENSALLKIAKKSDKGDYSTTDIY